MTQKRLEQYRALRREVAELERRLAELRSRPPDIVRDSVKGSSAHFPYTEHTYSIAGYGQRQQRKIERIEARLAARQERLLSEMDAIEVFVDSVDDSTTRQIISLRYIQGKSWQTTAEIVFNRVDRESTARMRIKLFFEKL